MTALTKNPQFITDNDCPDNHLTGTITTAKDNQMILTTIPFDKGWKVYVDGEEVSTYGAITVERNENNDAPVNSLIAFDIKSGGTHTLELKYDPIEHKLGAIISIAGIIIFILLCVADTVYKKLVKKNAKAPVDDVLWELEDIEEDAKALEELPPLEKKDSFSFKNLLSFLDSKKKDKESDEGSSEEAQNDTTDENDNKDQNGGN